MIKPHAIDHIVLRTERYQELIEFYCNVLGCRIDKVAADDFGLTHLRAGSAQIDIVDVHRPAGQSGGPAPASEGNNVDHFCLQIEAVDEAALKAYLEQNGVECGEFYDRYGAQGMGRSIYMKDLVGNNVELRFVIHE
ncbi:VOC family protein [Parahaliea maris]|uniref:VOC family protein n=1 Tax=Parahaliea maris TaxID=2716870 RepID=A0A5C8ZYN4_9GAMM|nr:VOC family protein [Parahaliea maris]TXS92919.1 VOC family protein [Parahaliea maris]